MHPHAPHADELEVDDLAPTDEIEYELSDDAETIVAVELLRARVRAARSWGA